MIQIYYMKKTVAKETKGANASVEKQVQQAVDRVKPVVQADGGNVEFIGIEQGVVRLRLTGACAHCPMSTYTLKQYLEQEIKKAVKGVKSVEQV